MKALTSRGSLAMIWLSHFLKPFYETIAKEVSTLASDHS
ncbi:hypothetical protein URH17368_2738 [Alicyclobacillus hesperidum URH17-3-68]|nr:hypothetical protein URH17368_2738 [Alicyclobacillus hesperidum URH17-3-68]